MLIVRKFKMPRGSQTKDCYKRMKEVTHKDYLEFIKENDSVIIEDVKAISAIKTASAIPFLI